MTNYKKQLITIDLNKLTPHSLLLLLLGLVGFVGVNLLKFKEQSTVWWIYLITLGAVILLTFVHELLHALAFIVFGKSTVNDIKFGGSFSSGMLYATTSKPMSRNAYLISLLLPTICTVIAGIIVSLLVPRFCYGIGFALLFSGCSGDIDMAKSIFCVPKEALILDHPQVPGYYAMFDENDLPEEFEEVTSLDERVALEKLNKYKKMSKNAVLAQIFIWLGLIALLIICIVLFNLLQPK